MLTVKIYMDRVEVDNCNICEKYQPQIAIRTSMSDCGEQEWMTNIPLYHIDRVKKYMEE